MNRYTEISSRCLISSFGILSDLETPSTEGRNLISAAIKCLLRQPVEQSNGNRVVPVFRLRQSDLGLYELIVVPCTGQQCPTQRQWPEELVIPIIGSSSAGDVAYRRSTTRIENKGRYGKWIAFSCNRISEWRSRFK
ncbi:hypothetical protein C0J52_15772 [Blattella germanica]|nr:hypothetical protein C0J52_15772 [Blattella germanica]